MESSRDARKDTVEQLLATPAEKVEDAAEVGDIREPEHCDELEGPFRSLAAREMCMKLFGRSDPHFLSAGYSITDKRPASSYTPARTQNMDTPPRPSLRLCYTYPTLH